MGILKNDKLVRPVRPENDKLDFENPGA